MPAWYINEPVWTSKTVITSSQTSWDFTGVGFADAQNGWIVGYRNRDESSSRRNKYKGIILYTTNGGSTWKQMPNPFERTSDSLTPFLKVKVTYFNNQFRGYIGCGKGYILRLNPVDTTWEPRRPSIGTSDSLTI
jgi:photosystem II stability/assembly factor-like uncharacterized protein